MVVQANLWASDRYRIVGLHAAHKEHEKRGLEVGHKGQVGEAGVSHRQLRPSGIGIKATTLLQMEQHIPGANWVNLVQIIDGKVRAKDFSFIGRKYGENGRLDPTHGAIALFPLHREAVHLVDTFDDVRGTISEERHAHFVRGLNQRVVKYIAHALVVLQ